MKNLASKLIEFYEKFIGEDVELKDYSLLEKRLEELREIKNSRDEIDLTDSQRILDSILDAFSLSLLSGNLDFSDTDFEFEIEDVTNIGNENKRKELFNDTDGNCKPLLFENRVRAYYSNQCNQILEDMDSKYQNQASCEFIVPLRDKKQLVECKSFGDYSINDSTEWKDIEEKFDNMEDEECEDDEETVRHLIMDVTKCCEGFRESKTSNAGSEHNGCNNEEMKDIEETVLENASGFDIDRISLVSYNLFRNNGLYRGLSERTNIVKAKKDVKGVIDYKGWTLTTRVDDDNNKNSFKAWRVILEGKKPAWVDADIDAKPPHQVFFSQQAAEEIPNRED